MNTYNKYKQSGVKWIGEIPEHWEVRKIKWEEYVEMGQSPSSSDYTLNVNDLPFLQGNADFTSIYPKPRVYCNTVNKKAYEKDILVSVRAPIGAINIADSTYGIGRGLSAIRTVNNYYKYLYYQFISRVEELQTLGTGSTFEAISVDDIRCLLEIIPPLSEQTTIASYLDHKTSLIDKLIKKNEKLIKLLEEKRKATINQAVTKGLNPNVRMKDSGVEWIGEIPEHWEVKKLKYISSIELGKMKDTKEREGYFLKPYLKARNLGWLNLHLKKLDSMYFSINEMERLRLKSGDLLVSEGGEVGKTAVWRDELSEIYIQNSVNKVTFGDNHNFEFYKYSFFDLGHKGAFDAAVNRVSIAHLTKEKLKEIVVTSPTNKEQITIASYLDRESKKIDQLVEKIKKQNTLLKEYRQSLISNVVTGKIDVRKEV